MNGKIPVSGREAGTDKEPARGSLFADHFLDFIAPLLYKGGTGGSDHQGAAHFSGRGSPLCEAVGGEPDCGGHEDGLLAAREDSPQGFTRSRNITDPHRPIIGGCQREHAMDLLFGNEREQQLFRLLYFAQYARIRYPGTASQIPAYLFCSALKRRAQHRTSRRLSMMAAATDGLFMV